MGPTWEVKVGPRWDPANFVRCLELGPTWAKWALCGTNMGAQVGPIDVAPHGLAHDGLYVGPTRVPCGQMNRVLHGLTHHGHYLGPMWAPVCLLIVGFTRVCPPWALAGSRMGHIWATFAGF